MKENNKASISTLKILCVSIIIMFLLGVGVTAVSSQLTNAKIVLADNYELNIITSKKNISEILKENHIVLLPDETVVPSLESEITENKTIIISKKENVNKIVQVSETSNQMTLDEILGVYVNVIEKIIVEQVVIPFETVTQDTSANNENKTNRVIQEGKDGIKEVTYKVKYKNDIEVERLEISSNIVQEPVNKIVQIKAKVVSSRGEMRTALNNPAVDAQTTLSQKVAGLTPKVSTFNTSAYTASTCGKSPDSSGYGVTSSGTKATSWYTVAAGKGYSIGTVIYIPYFQNKSNGGWFVVEDRGGAISNNKIDIYMDTYSECIAFGRRTLECYVYE